MLLHRGGKSSIQKVVFHKLSPNETLFLESTSKVVKDDINNSSFVQFQVSLSLCYFSPTFRPSPLLIFPPYLLHGLPYKFTYFRWQIWDFPGQIDFFDPTFDSEHIFGGCGALIFVIDAQVQSSERSAHEPSA